VDGNEDDAAVEVRQGGAYACVDLKGQPTHRVHNLLAGGPNGCEEVRFVATKDGMGCPYDDDERVCVGDLLGGGSECLVTPFPPLTARMPSSAPGGAWKP
jgi:hypothetical protein